jgi:hypothetical protein
MFLVFLVALIILAMIGLGSALGSGLAGLSAIIVLPILLVKVGFVLMLVGFVGRRMAGRRSSWDGERPGWAEHWRPRQEKPAVSHEDRFEEWHRMAHARQEVDDHTPPITE